MNIAINPSFDTVELEQVKKEYHTLLAQQHTSNGTTTAPPPAVPAQQPVQIHFHNMPPQSLGAVHSSHSTSNNNNVAMPKYRKRCPQEEVGKRCTVKDCVWLHRGQMNAFSADVIDALAWNREEDPRRKFWRCGYVEIYAG